jgi:phosphoribosylanthranilate isomerase
MQRTRIKICGVRDEQTALVAAACGADAIGLVFVRSSPRFVEPADAWHIVDALPPFVTAVGLFVDPPFDTYDDARDACPFTYTQLHGKESEPDVRDMGPDVIKGIRYDPSTIEADLLKWSRHDDVCAVLVDGGPGGTGETLDWKHLASVKHLCDHPLILAGGLTPENVGEAIRAVRPFAVDVSSGVESQRGVKDPAKVAAFCKAVREADHQLANA